MKADHDLLFARVCDGLATAEEIATFHRLLRTDADALDAWVHYSDLHGELAAGNILAETAEPEASNAVNVPLRRDERAAPRLVGPRGWLQWAPQAAAGLAVGLFAASIVWAYVGPPTLRTRSLLNEDFESSEVSLVARTVLETGVWRGDAAEIVGAQKDVRPARGAKMMRFRRDDFEGRAKPVGGHIAVVYHLIDLRPWRGEFSDGSGVVEVSASFNAAEFPADERYGCAISLYALNADSVPDRVGRLGSTLTNDALAMARSYNTKLDHDPASWQRLTSELRLPPDAEFLVVRLHINQAFESRESAVFTGSYADDIRVTLTRRAPLR